MKNYLESILIKNLKKLIGKPIISIDVVVSVFSLSFDKYVCCNKQNVWKDSRDIKWNHSHTQAILISPLLKCLTPIQLSGIYYIKSYIDHKNNYSIDKTWLQIDFCPKYRIVSNGIYIKLINGHTNLQTKLVHMNISQILMYSKCNFRTVSKA